MSNILEDTDATNELINDGQFVQPLTLEEIETLKQSGVHATDIIQKQIEQHANYSLKTEYSKEKYKKRKEAKYVYHHSTPLFPGADLMTDILNHLQQSNLHYSTCVNIGSLKTKTEYETSEPIHYPR